MHYALSVRLETFGKLETAADHLLRLFVQYAGGCVSSFIPSSNILPGVIVIGTPFLRAWHSQFIYDPVANKAQIGFSNPINTANVFTAAANNPLAAGGRRLLQNVTNAEVRNASNATNASNVTTYSTNSATQLFSGSNNALLQDPDASQPLFSATIPKPSDRGML